MIVYEKAGHQRLLAPMVEMYRVEDVGRFDQALDALRYSIENHDNSQLEKFHSAHIEGYRSDCLSKVWSIKSEHFRTFITKARQSIEFFETKDREELLLQIESKYQDGNEDVIVPAGIYELCLGGLRQVFRVTKFPGGLAENQFFFEHYNEWFNGVLGDL